MVVAQAKTVFLFIAIIRYYFWAHPFKKVGLSAISFLYVLGFNYKTKMYQQHIKKDAAAIPCANSEHKYRIFK